MTGQLVAGQFALEAALAELAAADSVVRDKLRGQISLIAGLRQQVGTSQGNALSALRAQVATVADSATAIAQDARISAAADASSASTIGMLARTARDQTNAVVAGMKDFDRDLKFGPGDTEADYRQREAERQSYIAEQQAKHTPVGDFNASGAAVGQMADAKAHGAHGPEFDKRWDALTASTETLRAQLVRDGKDVSQFDAHLRDDLRTIMRAKGVPDAQIDAMLAAHPDNPLEAVKAFVAEQKGVIGEKEIGDLSRKAQEDKDTTENKQVNTATTAKPVANIPASALDAMAGLKALGVVAGEHDPDSQPAHGVTATAQLIPNQGIAARS